MRNIEQTGLLSDLQAQKRYCWQDGRIQRLSSSQEASKPVGSIHPNRRSLGHPTTAPERHRKFQGRESRGAVHPVQLSTAQLPLQENQVVQAEESRRRQASDLELIKVRKNPLSKATPARMQTYTPPKLKALPLIRLHTCLNLESRALSSSTEYSYIRLAAAIQSYLSLVQLLWVGLAANPTWGASFPGLLLNITHQASLSCTT